MFRAVSFPQHPTAFKWLVTCHLLLALAAFLLVSPFMAGLACVMSLSLIHISGASAAMPGSDGTGRGPSD